MAETLSSAVAQEAVHHVVHKLKETYEHSSTFTAKKSIERMEMAHIRLEAALEASRQWSISSAPLLRWRSKLKRATQECDHTLRRCKRRLQEEKESYSLPSVVARAAMSLVSSIFGHGGDEEVGGSASAMRRFEWFADSASEFLRYVEIGGSTPWRFVFFDSALVRHLLEGKGTKNCFVHGGQHLSFVLQPFSASECGMECTLIFSHKDGDAPEDNFLLSLNLRLSESTNIIGVVVRCMELFAPHLSSTAEAVKTKLTQLPMQDLRWVPDAHVIPVRDEHWDNLYTIFSKWCRPNPLCCQQQHQSYNTQRYAAGSSSAEPLVSDIYLEPVIQVYCLGHVTLPAENNRQLSATTVDSGANDSPYLKLGCMFWPHTSSEDLSPAVGGAAIEMVNGEPTQCGLYANISFGQLGEIMLPKVVDCLCGDMAATSYQTIWRSKHGHAYLQAEQTSWWSSTRKEDGGARRRKNINRSWTSENSEFMNSWIVHAPAQLQDSTVDWVQKQSHLPLPLLWKTTSCTHDCPIMLSSLQVLKSLARKIKSLNKGLNDTIDDDHCDDANIAVKARSHG